MASEATKSMPTICVYSLEIKGKQNKIKSEKSAVKFALEPRFCNDPAHLKRAPTFQRVFVCPKSKNQSSNGTKGREAIGEPDKLNGQLR